MKVLLVLVFFIVGIREIPELIKNKYTKELVAFIVFLGFAFIIAILQAFDVKIPSPLKFVGYFIEEVLHISYSGYK